MPGHYGQKPALSDQTLAQLGVELEDRFGKQYGDEDGKKYHQVEKDNGLFDLYLIGEASTDQRYPGKAAADAYLELRMRPGPNRKNLKKYHEDQGWYLIQLLLVHLVRLDQQLTSLSLIHRETAGGMFFRLMLLLLPRDGKDRMRMPIQAAWLCMILRQIKPVRYRRIYSL